ncbi:hypothetical protein [Aridibaculum aurantiacum]|uniref:hypothetical protein n=1 Tax=Aridibaculum aurantiacum TaxID=2810307 RepID=UPI001A96EDA3|nr:hypothetical protein [Aridibaculum aurantiacum]
MANILMFVSDNNSGRLSLPHMKGDSAIENGGWKAFTWQNKHYLWIALLAGITHFIILRWLYPVPSYFADSFTYVGAAANNQPISFRPIFYSKLIQFFRLLSTSELALIAGQYGSWWLANLFLFFTSCYFFLLKGWKKYLLFALLILHPFWVFSSNYISSDTFFNSLTVAWFTLLIWVMHKPKWYIISLHLWLLLMIFMLRYNAVYFPIFTAVAILFATLSTWKKLAYILVAVAFVFSFIEYTSRQTEKLVGTKIFTGFSGWQYANNALHVVRNKKIDPSTIENQKVRELLVFNQSFFNTYKDSITTKASAWYMWHPQSPLKLYLRQHNAKAGFFRTWNELAPLYGKFGKTIILQNPVAYIQHFVVPNLGEYVLPRLELYDTYFEDVDTVAAVATKYFNYKSNKVSKHRPALYTAVFGHSNWLFLVLNVMGVGLGCWYYFSKQYRKYPKLINRFLLCFALFFLANFFFIVLLAPSVLRYHVPIIALAIPIVLFLITTFTNRKNEAAGSVV